MKLKDFVKSEPKGLEFIAEVFPKNGLTLLHGQQGSGKSYTCIKELNKADIIPVYIAVEDSYGLSDLDKIYVEEELFDAMIKGEKIEGLNDSVVIIDTYTRIKYKLESQGYDNPQILTLLERIREFYNLTLIVIGHTRNFVGKDGIFDDNTVLARGVGEELFLEKSSYKATKVIPAHIKYNLHVVKGRGNGGARIVESWGRNNEEKDV